MQNKSKLIDEAAKQLTRRLKTCDICPRNCRVNRLGEGVGYCKAGKDIVVYTSFLHGGEEPALSSSSGSGTIFFSGCNLGCIYCQNYKFSHALTGVKKTTRELANIMLKFQEEKAHNINLVTPTHFLPQILQSLNIAVSEGLNIPIVYNTSGYEKAEIVKLLDGIVDIYLPDMKYFNEEAAGEYSNAANYNFYCKEALLEMYRQKPKASFAGEILTSGLIIRHLVLPGSIDETITALSWIKNNLPGCLTSIMFQYQPYHKAKQIQKINRAVNLEEYKQVKEAVQNLGLKGWIQDLTAQEDMAGVYFKPDE